MKISQTTCRGKKNSVILYPVRLPIWTTKVYSRLLPLRTPLLRTRCGHLPFGQLRRHSWWAQVGQLLEVQPLAGPPLRRLLHFEAPVEESGRLLIGCYWVLKQGARGHDGVKGKKESEEDKSPLLRLLLVSSFYGLMHLRKFCICNALLQRKQVLMQRRRQIYTEEVEWCGWKIKQKVIGP